MHKLFPLLLILLSGVVAEAQDTPPEGVDGKPKLFQLNGLGRVILENTDLKGNLLDTDTTTARRLTGGEFLLDLQMSVRPNEQTEVQGILRLRNEFGGFFGAGVSVEVRELFARGLIANTVRYHVGDMDLAWSPFTLNNWQEEGTVNEPAIFMPQKEVIYYDLFYHEGNRRRYQGARLEFGLSSSQLDEINLDGFFARVRGTDFFTVPSRFITGGKFEAVNYRWGKLGFRYLSTFDDISVGEANDGIRNPVYSGNIEFYPIKNDAFGLSLFAEAGQSSVKFKQDSTTTFDRSDFFAVGGVGVEFPQSGLKIKASFHNVGPDFFSVGAQSRRVDLQRDKTYFNRVGNERSFRQPNLFDLVQDRALYTFQLNDKLTRYDPRFSNTFPYGDATPNRQGLRLGLEWMPDSGWVQLDVDLAYLSEIRGQGTEELRTFLYGRLAADLGFQNLYGGSMRRVLTLGYQYEQSDRGGVEIEQVDLTNHLIDIGIEFELVRALDILAGGKLLFSQGREYLPVYTRFNQVERFLPIEADDSEILLAAGLRYRFTERIALNVQYENFQFERQTDLSNAYGFSQFYLQYVMKF